MTQSKPAEPEQNQTLVCSTTTKPWTSGRSQAMTYFHFCLSFLWMISSLRARIILMHHDSPFLTPCPAGRGSLGKLSEQIPLLVKGECWSKWKCPRDVKNRRENMTQLLSHQFDSDW